MPHAPYSPPRHVCWPAIHQLSREPLVAQREALLDGIGLRAALAGRWGAGPELRLTIVQALGRADRDEVDLALVSGAVLTPDGELRVASEHEPVVGVLALSAAVDGCIVAVQASRARSEEPGEPLPLGEVRTRASLPARLVRWDPQDSSSAPVGRLIRAQSAWEVDPSYAPPLLRLGSHPAATTMAQAGVDHLGALDGVVGRALRRLAEDLEAGISFHDRTGDLPVLLEELRRLHDGLTPLLGPVVSWLNGGPDAFYRAGADLCRRLSRQLDRLDARLSRSQTTLAQAYRDRAPQLEAPRRRLAEVATQPYEHTRMQPCLAELSEALGGAVAVWRQLGAETRLEGEEWLLIEEDGPRRGWYRRVAAEPRRHGAAAQSRVRFELQALEPSPRWLQLVFSGVDRAVLNQLERHPVRWAFDSGGHLGPSVRPLRQVSAGGSCNAPIRYVAAGARTQNASPVSLLVAAPGGLLDARCALFAGPYDRNDAMDGTDAARRNDTVNRMAREAS